MGVFLVFDSDVSIFVIRKDTNIRVEYPTSITEMLKSMCDLLIHIIRRPRCNITRFIFLYN